MKANSASLPPIPVKTGPGRKRSPGPVPAWGLKLGGFLTTAAVFASSFGFAATHLYTTNAPLKPATVAAATATATPSTSNTSTTTLTPRVRTTTRAAVTNTASS